MADKKNTGAPAEATNLIDLPHGDGQIARLGHELATIFVALPPNDRRLLLDLARALARKVPQDGTIDGE